LDIALEEFEHILYRQGFEVIAIDVAGLEDL